MSAILVIAESTGCSLESATLAAITAARQASALLEQPFDLLIVGEAGSADVAARLCRYGARRVLLSEDPALDVSIAERILPTYVAIAAQYGLILATGTGFGRDLLPRIATKLDAAYVGDCVGIVLEGGELCFQRSVHAGNVLEFVHVTTSVRVATVRQCEFEPATPSGAPSAVEPVAYVPFGDAGARISLVGEAVVPAERPGIEQAKAVVSGGRVLKSRFFEVLEPLARELGAVLGATRTACDAGYAPSELQVGQSGHIVAPRIYIAVGISGAIQHIAGIRRSRVIVAINRDPEAPIFRFANYGLVADLFEAVPALVEELRQCRRQDPPNGA